MKLFLINPDYMLYGDPPLGLAYLAAYIREKCPFIEIKILDQLTHEQILKKINQQKPGVIGITAVSSNYYKAKLLAKKLRLLYQNQS